MINPGPGWTFSTNVAIPVADILLKKMRETFADRIFTLMEQAYDSRGRIDPTMNSIWWRMK